MIQENIKELVLNLQTELPSYLLELIDVVRAFEPYIIISKEDVLNKLILKCFPKDNLSLFTLEMNGEILENVLPFPGNDSQLNVEEKRANKLFAKKIVYQFCVVKTGAKLPYGSLTGVRPIKFYRQHQGWLPEGKNFLLNEIGIAKKTLVLLDDVFKNQKEFFQPSKNDVDIYVNIPICKTICKYCSFSSISYNKAELFIENYIDCLLIELHKTRDKITEDGLKLNCIYIGGGTPTCLPIKQFERVLKELPAVGELTVEAGRPDSITNDYLKMLSDYGVSRISINPQSFNEATLIEIGRKHSVSSIYGAYEIARNYEFDINMDLILGLPKENIEDYTYSLKSTIELAPENITLHSLSIKRGSAYKNEGLKKGIVGSVDKMREMSRTLLRENEYLPYYLYRQKNISDNLENIGFCLPNKQCRYNINYMEDANSVLGIGAGAVSKYINFDENIIQRKINKREIKLYCLDVLNNT